MGSRDADGLGVTSGGVDFRNVNRDAVLDAVDEYEDLGREGFLAKYGFPAQSDVLIDYVGQRYDGLAVLAAAHGFQHGTALLPQDLADQEPEIVVALSALKFHVVTAGKALARPAARTGRPRSARKPRRAPGAAATPAPSAGRRLPPPEWTLEAGESVLRRDLIRVHGGALGRHIEPTGRTPNVLVFTDPSKPAHTHDGWSPERDAYYVTGDGRRGDQTWTTLNEALRDHARSGRVVRLFEPEEGWRPGGQRHCYLGAFRVDAAEPYRTDIAPDSDGADRQVIVFRLVPAQDGDVRDDAPPGDAEPSDTRSSQLG